MHGACVIVLPVATADSRHGRRIHAGSRVPPAVVGRRLRCCSDDRRQFFAPHHRRPSAVGRRRRPGRHFRRGVRRRPAGAVPHRWRAGPPDAASRPGAHRDRAGRASRAAAPRSASTACPARRPTSRSATPLATGLHLVDSPVFDRDGNLYVTFSGSRGQQAPVSVFVVRPDGTREPFVADVPNPTSMAFDRDGHALRLVAASTAASTASTPTGRPSIFATDLGVACGIAFGPDGALYVGDRSGSILRVADGRATLVASIPASVAAFHLAFGPDGFLYVTAPTLARARPRLPRCRWTATSSVFYDGFGRPQGLAFDDRGSLYVVDALAGLQRRLPVARRSARGRRSRSLPAAT